MEKTVSRIRRHDLGGGMVSIHCLNCVRSIPKKKRWKECSECSYSEKVSDDMLHLVPSGLLLDKDGNVFIEKKKAIL